LLKVLSLFDGGSTGLVALEDIGLKANVDFIYYSSEIDKNAIKCSEDNHPNKIIRLGDVNKITYNNGIITYEDISTKELKEIDVGQIDLLIGGSPCQSFSPIGKQEGFEGKSGLFYEYLRILKSIQESNPNVIFFLENVRMRKDYKKNLDDYLETEGIFMCSSLVSYQKRARIYWSNKPFTIPEDQNISFQNFKDTTENQAQYKLPINKSTIAMWNNGEGRNNVAFGCANVTNLNKIYCLTTKQYRTPNSGLVQYEDWCRLLTREELEQAQNLPIGYTKSLSYNQAQAVLGNGWTMKIVSHIFREILNVRSN